MHINTAACKVEGVCGEIPFLLRSHKLTEISLPLFSPTLVFQVCFSFSLEPAGSHSIACHIPAKSDANDHLVLGNLQLIPGDFPRIPSKRAPRIHLGVLGCTCDLVGLGQKGIGRMM